MIENEFVQNLLRDTDGLETLAMDASDGESILLQANINVRKMERSTFDAIPLFLKNTSEIIDILERSIKALNMIYTRVKLELKIEYRTRFLKE